MRSSYVTTGVTLIGLLDGFWLRFAICLLLHNDSLHLPIHYGNYFYFFEMDCITMIICIFLFIMGNTSSFSKSIAYHDFAVQKIMSHIFVHDAWYSHILYFYYANRYLRLMNICHIICNYSINIDLFWREVLLEICIFCFIFSYCNLTQTKDFNLVGDNNAKTDAFIYSDTWNPWIGNISSEMIIIRCWKLLLASMPVGNGFLWQ